MIVVFFYNYKMIIGGHLGVALRLNYASSLMLLLVIVCLFEV